MATTGGIVEEIIDYLVTQSYGTKGGDIWYNHLPTTPKNITVLYELDGDQTIHSSVNPVYRFQATVRNQTIQAGRAKTKALKDLLHGQSDFLAFSKVALCKCLSFPVRPVRNPENELYEFYLNFNMTVKEVF